MARLREFQGLDGTNFFEQDRGFHLLLDELIGEEDRAQVFESLARCGGLVAGRWNDLAREANRNENLPKIIKQDPVGRPIERVDFGPFTRQLRREVAEFGLFTGARNEIHKFALIYLLAHNGEASLNCGISCTDGLIRSIEARGSDFLRKEYLPRLLSSETPFAGAQFVTEQSGGSDVGAIESTAALNEDGTWAITGEKWFCSNPDEFFLVAARPSGARGGTGELAVFMVPRVMMNGEVNRISFKRLKDKLGTRSLPTAEIDFDRAVGYAIGDTTEGFKTLMSYVINASRTHNAVNACGFLHRAFLEARNYARQREAFGHALIEYPLIQETLVGMLEKLWRNRLLTFKLIALIERHGIAPEDAGQSMWQRFLLNLAKYRTSVTLADSIREAILVLGGNGIVEDFTILPRLLRDTLIIETWEGPHNTLCLQILRDARRSPLVPRWRAAIEASLDAWPAGLLESTRSAFERVFEQTVSALSEEKLSDRRWAEAHARRLVDRMGELLEVGWMAETAARLQDSPSGDATAAVLTSIAGYRLFPNENAFDHPALAAITAHAAPLIEERVFRADVERL